MMEEGLKNDRHGGHTADKRKLIILLGLLLGAGFIVTTLVSYFVSRGSIRESIVVNELPLTSDNIYSEIQKDLVRPIFISSMMASDTFLRDWVLAGEKDLGKMGKYLKEVKTRYGLFTSFFVSERSHAYYYADGILKTVKQDEPRDLWYSRVRGMERPYEINVDPDLANRDALTIFVNYRVFDYSGNFIGATGVGLTVDAVRKLIGDYQQRYRRNIFFTDAGGNIVLLGSGAENAAKNIRDIPGLGGQAGRILAERRGTFQYQSGGRLHLLNVRFIPELNWFLFVEKAEDEALFEIRKTLYMNLAISLAVMIVVLMLTNLTINRYQRTLEKMATTDKLTGVANRQAFELIAERALRDAHRTRESLSVILIDIDHFKEINDRLGHLTGDAVIQAVAQAIQDMLRESDLVCRWGGEEFLVLLKSCDAASAQVLAEKFRAGVGALRFSHGGDSMGVTASFGIAQYNGSETMEQVFGRADQALYAAKRAGRDRVSLA